MLPDVVDEAALKNDVRREELFYAFFVFGNKFGSGITLGLSTAIYKSVTHSNSSILIGSIFDLGYHVREKSGNRTPPSLPPGLLAMTRTSVISLGQCR